MSYSSSKMDSSTDSGGGGGPSQSDSKRQGLISVNNLNYVLEPDHSVATNCTYKNHFFQQDKYNEATQSICILNSGADYIDTRRSYLKFDLFVKGGVGSTITNGEFSLLGGSAMNLIDNITISSRSGDELARIRKTNLWSATVNPYRHTRQWHDTVGQAAMFDYVGTADNYSAGVGTHHTVCIPMYLLTDFFNQAKLMPSMLMSGLRIEIQWAPATVALKKIINVTEPISTGSLTFEVSQLHFALKSVQLTDATQRALNEMSAVNGLEVVYCDYENTEQQQQSDQFHIEVRKASSRALKAFVKSRDITDLGDTSNDFLSEFSRVNKYQWQLGSLYFPQQPVTAATGLLMDPEAYYHTLDSFDKLQPASTPPMVGLHPSRIAEYKTGGNGHPTTGTLLADTFNAGRGVYGVTLERSTLFNFAGVPINNSRVLAWRATYQTSGSITHNINIFLKYVKLARVFLNNVEVEQ